MYLEIDSTYRHRRLFPFPGDFRVSFSETSTTFENAIDPVCDSAPLAEWQSNRFKRDTFGSSSIQCKITNFTVVYNQLKVIFSATELNTVDDYYRNCFVTCPGVSCRIISYRYLGNDSAEISLESIVDLPIGTNFLIKDPTDLNIFKIFVPSSPSNADNFYASNILYDETVNEYSPITFFDSSTGCVTCKKEIPGWTITDSFSIRKSPPLFFGVAGPESTESIINTNGGNKNLNSCEVRICPSYPPMPPCGEISTIINFNSNSVKVLPKFTESALGKKFEILKYSYDNYRPLTGIRYCKYTDFKIKLLNLTLPSAPLSVGYGCTISDYPYIYVKLIDTNSSGDNKLCSNNPNTGLFRAIKRDSIDTFFTTFNGDGIVREINLTMNTDLDFSVTLPTGEIFQTLEADKQSPYKPNPLLQISALFEIIPIEKE